jgi:hypothetical protein
VKVAYFFFRGVALYNAGAKTTFGKCGKSGHDWIFLPSVQQFSTQPDGDTEGPDFHAPCSLKNCPGKIKKRKRRMNILISSVSTIYYEERMD